MICVRILGASVRDVVLQASQSEVIALSLNSEKHTVSLPVTRNHTLFDALV